MSPIEHYFENLLDIGSDIKGEPNKNALSKEVQEAIEECADYVKYDLLLRNTKANMVSILEEIQNEIFKESWRLECLCDDLDGSAVDLDDIKKIIQQKIDQLKENTNK